MIDVYGVSVANLCSLCLFERKENVRASIDSLNESGTKKHLSFPSICATCSHLPISSFMKQASMVANGEHIITFP